MKTKDAVAAADQRQMVLEAQLAAVYKLSRDMYASPEVRNTARKRVAVLRVTLAEAEAEVTVLKESDRRVSYQPGAGA